MSRVQEWYYLEGEEGKGPFDLEVMRQLWVAGVLDPQSYVARGGDANWSAAEHLLAPLVSQGGASREIVSHRVPAAAPVSSSSAVWHAGWPALLLALASLLVLLLPGVFLWDQLCESRGPQDLISGRGLSGKLPAIVHHLMPTNRLEVKDGIQHALIYTLVCLGGAAGMASSARLRGRLLERSRKAAVWLTPLHVMGWLGVIVGCAVITFLSPIWRSAVMFSQRYLLGSGGTSELRLIAVAVAVAVTLATVAILIVRKHAKRASMRHGSKPLLVMASGNLGVTAINLALCVAAIPAIFLITRKPIANPDREVAVALLDSFDSFQQRNGDRLIAYWAEPEKESSLFGPRDTEPFDVHIRARRNADGDVVGISTGRLVDLLSGDEAVRAILTQTSYIDPRFAETREIEDAWNLEPFRITLDSNADGRLRIAGQEIQAQAAVWSVGWNGQDEQGGGDDVLTIRH